MTNQMGFKIGVEVEADNGSGVWKRAIVVGRQEGDWADAQLDVRTLLSYSVCFERGIADGWSSGGWGTKSYVRYPMHVRAFVKVEEPQPKFHVGQHVEYALTQKRWEKGTVIEDHPGGWDGYIVLDDENHLKYSRHEDRIRPVEKAEALAEKIQKAEK